MSRNHPPPGVQTGPPFAVHRVVDELHQGMTVATFEHPPDWPAHSQLVWNFEDSSFPLTSYAATSHPRGAEAVEFLPAEVCFWVEPNVMFTQGQKYRGSTCLPPMGGLDALTRWAIPKHRGDRENLRLLYAQPVPNLAQLLGADDLRNVRHEGVTARVEYGENGRRFEEEFYACVMWHPPNTGQYNWGLVRFFCYRAERGQLDAARQRLWRIATSLRPNPAWGRVFDQIVEQLNAQRMAFLDGVKAQQAAQIDWGRKLGEYRAWQSDLSQQQFNDRWESQQRRSDQAGDVLSGTQRFHDPASAHGNPHVEHGHHQYVWTNGREGWIYSHDANYDPNRDPSVANGPWSLARRL